MRNVAARTHIIAATQIRSNGKPAGTPANSFAEPATTVLSGRMKLLLVTIVSLLLPASTSLLAQAPYGGPEVTTNRMVTFRVKAAGARTVEVGGQFARERIKLASIDSNEWSGTCGPVAPGIHEYSVYVDGRAGIDRGNPAIKPQREPQASILHIPDAPPAPWDWQDVPHGTVHHHGYLSKALQRPRELCVYTPPGYDTEQARRYPLLVLQHGSGDNHLTWVVHGKAHWIMDNLAAAGRIRPMVVLMLDGHPLGMVGRESSPQRKSEALSAFQRELFEDALPLVESCYRIEKGPAHRAIAGLSMGGNQSLVTGLTHPDQFAWVAGMSSAIRDRTLLDTLIANPEKANHDFRLIWIGCGKDDFLLNDNRALDQLLTEKKITHTLRETEGGHSWPVWRGYLAELAPRLFAP